MMDPTSEKTIETSEDFHDELVRIKEENSTLNRRLLGVNELARLLQEKTEVSNSLQEKNKRLEIAVVRLENRCSNLERKAKTAQYSSLPSNPGGTANPKSMPNSPFIPGPSRQILESLMKENHELKKTINNLTKGGPVGYKEAVKMNHLEEVIDQKNGKIDLLQKQIENLTAPHDEDGSRVDPGLLKRQLLKMEQAMKVKDRFCTLLSDRVSELERGREGTDGDDETEKGDNDSSRHVRDLEVKEKKFRSMIDELQSQVEKERGDKKDLLSKAEDSSRKVTNLDLEIVSLNRKVESLSTYNNTLVSEKMDLSGDVMRLNDKLQQTQNESKKKEDDFTRKYTDMQEKFKDLEEDNASLSNQLFEVNCKLNELTHKPSGGGGVGRAGPIISGLGLRDLSMRPYDPLGNRGQEVVVDGRGNRLRNSPEPQQQQHCAPSMVHYMHQTMLATRDVDGNTPDTTVPPTVTTPAITPSSASTRSLELSSMPQNYRYRNPQTPSQYPPPPQFIPVDGSHWQQHHFGSRPQTLTSNLPSSNQALPPMSMPHPYHVPNMPLNAPPSYSGSVFGNVPPPQFTSTNASMGSTPVNYPGSGYMTHSSTDYQTARYYTNSPQPPTLQRRPSPPNQQHNNAGGSGQHYHTGQ